MSNPTRLLIVDARGQGEKCVADMTALVGLDIYTVSSHLSVLRKAGLLADERRGTRGFFYMLRNPCVLKIFRCLHEFNALSGRKSAASLSKPRRCWIRRSAIWAVKSNSSAAKPPANRNSMLQPPASR